MRFISRSAFVVLVAVFVMSVGVASASVCHEPEHDGHVGLCVEHAKVTGEKVAFTWEAKPSTRIIPFWVSNFTKINCEKAIGSGIFNTIGSSLVLEHTKIEFSGCHTEGLSHCAVSPVAAEAKGSFEGEVTSNVKLTGAKPNETFEEFSIESHEGICTVAEENIKITGAQTCELPSGEENREVHEVDCYFRGNQLKWATKEVKLELTAMAKLVSAKKWGVMAG